MFYVFQKGKDYVIHLTLPNYPFFRNCSFSASCDLNILLNDSKYSCQYIEQSENVDSFLDEITNLIVSYIQVKITSITYYFNVVQEEFHTKSNTSYESKFNTADYSSVIKDIDSIGWKNLCSINSSFSEIKLKSFDSCQREHILSVKLCNSTNFQIHTDFPGNVEFWKMVIIETFDILILY